MTINLHHFIIHGLKQVTEQRFEPVYQPQELAKTEAAQQLIAELHQRFNAKPSKGIGRFSPESDAPFVASLRYWQQHPDEFVGFSKSAASAMAEKMQAYDLANDCYLLLAHYHYVAHEFLLIAELPIKEKVTCDDQLQLARLRYLDSDSMQLAARFDLLRYQSEPDSPMAAFVKGRAGRKVADFFLDAMAIEEAIDRRAHAEQLSAVVHDYCQQHVPQKEVQSELKKEVVSFCKEQQVAGEAVRLDELSEALQGSAEVSFIDFIAAAEVALPEQLEPEVKTLQRMTRYTGSGKGVSISFDAALLGSRVRYDAQADRLIIDEIPPNLKDQLLRQLAGSQ